jgi:NAD(P)-dependent dehydrogenase (short-subunit alcohol dehydrogenase family)
VAVLRGADSPSLLRSRLDVTDEGSIRDSVAAAQARFGQLDAVVNNAGVGVYGTAEETTEADLRWVFDVNFFGAVAVTRAVLPQMRERGGGRLVFVSSDWGRTGFPAYSGYCASKHALEGWCESLHHETRRFGICVTLVEPGAFDTGFERRSLRQIGAVKDPGSPYAGLYRAVEEGLEGDPGPGGEPVAQAILSALESEDPPLRIPVGEDAVEWTSARFRPGEEEFVKQLGRRYGWRGA